MWEVSSICPVVSLVLTNAAEVEYVQWIYELTVTSAYVSVELYVLYIVLTCVHCHMYTCTYVRTSVRPVTSFYFT